MHQRRSILTSVTAIGALALVPLLALPAHAAPADPPTGATLTVLGTTDVHGHVLNWDYFADAPYEEDDQLGLSRAATVIADIRAQRGADSVLLLDNGDAIQGTPLTSLAQRDLGKPGWEQHPMAEAYNVLEYDAVNNGNHEFNYGLEVLETYQNQLDAPLLGANVLQAGTTTPAFEPYTIIERQVDGDTVKVGVLGLVTPGVRIWDKAHVEGVLEFQDVVLAAQQWVPEMKQNGAEVVVALVHAGLDAEGYEWDPADLEENVAQSVAEHVNDIDLVIGGHSHVDIPSRVFKAPDGDTVLFTQPYYWARSVSEVRLPLAKDAAGASVVSWPATDEEIANLVTPHYGKDTVDSPLITQNPVLSAQHAATVSYVNTVVATNVAEMRTETSRYEDTPILDLIGKVMVDAVAAGLEGTEHADLPVIAQTSPFSRTSVFPEGDLTIKDIAGLYIYDNTLQASLVNGAQLRDYLEFSARFFKQATPEDPWNPETHTNALYPGETRGIPDYNYDALTGVGYRLDITRPAGERVVDLTYQGAAVADDDEFALAVNNYRRSGGGGFPVADLPLIWDEQLEIRQLIIDYASEVGVIDQSNFFEPNWSLVTDPAQSGAGTGGSTSSATPSPSRSAELSDTGPSAAGFVGLAVALVLAGGAVLIWRRRRETRV